MKKNFLQRAEYFLVLLFFIFIAFLLYHHVLHGEFVSDDHLNIVESQAIRNPFDLPRIWEGMNTRFLTGWTFSWNYFFGKLDPFGYHLVNVLVHTLNSFLVYCLALLILNTPILKSRRLIRPPRAIAFFSALIFLCHPVQTQGVSFIFQRSVSLAAFFYLLTLNGYLWARMTGEKKFVLLALFSMALGVFCKENMLTLPLALLGVEFFFWPREKGAAVETIKRVVPFAFLAGLIPLILMLDSGGENFNFKHQLTARGFSIHYFLTELNVLVTYLRLFVFPVNLMHDYDYPLARGLFEPRTFFSLALLSAVIWAGVRSFKRDRLTSFCIFWFFLTTSVEAGVVCFVNRIVIFEHWMYLPMAGLSILAASLLFRLVKNVRILRIICCAVVCVLCVLTYQRNFVWQKELVFWEDNLAKVPKNPRVNFAIGSIYLGKGIMDKAQLYTARALEYSAPAGRLDGELASHSLNNMGMVFLSKGQRTQAVKMFQSALEVWPGNAKAHNNLGLRFYEEGRLDKAQEHLNTSLRLQGEYAFGRFYLGKIALQKGDVQKAQAQFQQARQLFEAAGDLLMAREADRLLKGRP